MDYLEDLKYGKRNSQEPKIEEHENLYLTQEPYNRYDGGDYDHAETL